MRDATERITFDGMGAADPTVLSDGRILYVGVDLGAGEPRPALWTVHPDGSGATLFHSATPAARYARPREGADGTVRFLAHAEAVRIAVIDVRAPHEAASVLGAPIDVRAVEPLPDGSWIVLGRGATGISMARHAGAEPLQTLELPDAGTVEDVCAIAPRRRPQGHLSSVRRGETHGQLLCLDARPEGVGDAVRVRIHGRAGTSWRVLGEGRTEADGSFYVEVPSDTPLRLEVLDAQGGVLSETQTPFWVRPAEIRGCVGCHAPGDETPPNRRPDAAAYDVVPVAAWRDLRSMYATPSLDREPPRAFGKTMPSATH